MFYKKSLFSLYKNEYQIQICLNEEKKKIYQVLKLHERTF